MPAYRTPLWMYVVAAVYIFTFFFNAQQEAFGPASTGWTASWPALTVAAVHPNGPMAKAGVQSGDVIETVDGRPIRGMPDWFVARAHFRRDHPIDLQLRRGERQVKLLVVITSPAWRTWTRTHLYADIAFYGVRFLLLLLAIYIGFRHPYNTNFRLAALLLAMGAVAEGYPSSGWAGALQRLPAIVAVPTCLAVASCLLSSVPWLWLFARFPGKRFSQLWLERLILPPVLILVVPILVSSYTLIYAPELLARNWPELLSAAPVRVIQDAFGVAPLLYLNPWPSQQPTLQLLLLELWAAVSFVYFATGALMLLSNSMGLERRDERRRFAMLTLAVFIFAGIALHNVLTRNWVHWFGSAPPPLFFPSTFVVEDALFLLLPMALANCLLSEERSDGSS